MHLFWFLAHQLNAQHTIECSRKERKEKPKGNWTVHEWTNNPFSLFFFRFSSALVCHCTFSLLKKYWSCFSFFIFFDSIWKIFFFFRRRTIFIHKKREVQVVDDDRVLTRSFKMDYDRHACHTQNTIALFDIRLWKSVHEIESNKRRPKNMNRNSWKK